MTRKDWSADKKNSLKKVYTFGAREILHSLYTVQSLTFAEDERKRLKKHSMHVYIIWVFIIHTQSHSHCLFVVTEYINFNIKQANHTPFLKQSLIWEEKKPTSLYIGLCIRSISLSVGWIVGDSESIYTIDRERKRDRETNANAFKHWTIEMAPSEAGRNPLNTFSWYQFYIFARISHTFLFLFCSSQHTFLSVSMYLFFFIRSMCVRVCVFVCLQCVGFYCCNFHDWRIKLTRHWSISICTCKFSS